MRNEKFLKIAQATEKDERDEHIVIKAHRLAGNISTLFASILAMIVIVDGYIIQNHHSFDFLTVAFMLIGVGAVNNFVFSVYQCIVAKKRSRIIDIIIFGTLMIGATVKIIAFLGS